MSVTNEAVSAYGSTRQSITGRIIHSNAVSANINYDVPAIPSNNHAIMLNRDAKNQHPIEAISDLPEILEQIDAKLLGIVNDWMMDESGFLYLLANGRVVIGPIGPFDTGTGGSGAGGNTVYNISVTNLLDSRMITVAEGERVVLKFNYSSIDDESMDDGPGLGQIIVSGSIRMTFSANQGNNEIDVTEFLSAGTNNVTVRISNSENSSKPLAYVITVAAVSLVSSFDASVPYSGTIVFPYTPIGIAEKTVHFELDGKEIGVTHVSTSGRQLSYSIPKQSHGAHILRAWFTCDIEGATIISNILYYSIICTEDGDTTPIVAMTIPPASNVEQYSNVVTKYRVYNPSALMASITLEINGDAVQNLTVDRTEQIWSYQPTITGTLTRSIRCGDTYVSWTQNVTESDIKVEAETEALALCLSSYGRSNNEDDPGVWENNGISAEFSNFNFVSDGWLMDDDNNTVLRVSGDARLYIPYKIFAYDFRTTGKTLEFELATRDVMDYSAEVLNCYSGGRGFRITAQELTMTSEQSGLGTRYKENEHIRVSIVAEKKSENRLLVCYINGIMSGAVQYPDDDDFSQAVPVGITIGSNNCTTDLYNIRAYDNSLTRYQTLDNWIADTQNSFEKLSRYKRNDIYDAYGQVVISKLPNDLPYLVLQGSELPQFKDDKKIISGYFTDPMHPDKSYSFTGAQIDVQGTSSQYYYRKNYKIKYKEGFVLYNGTTSETYQMNENAVPTDTFTMKADVASSEGAFNVILSMLYNELCPYKTPAQVADPKIRQTIEGFPCVIFWDNGSELKFLGKYNFNNDKGTEEVFGFKAGDESWEIRQNGTKRVGWHSADFDDPTWTDDFEVRYLADEDNVKTDNLRELAEWLVSTDVSQATNEPLEPDVTYDAVKYTTDSKEYRLAKFSAELSDHFIEKAIIFYYLFTEIFLSIDQREKNAFPTYLANVADENADGDTGRWIVLFYDADSSCGTDNNGNLSFDYYLEDIDKTKNNDPIYNGQDSVLWCNLRETRRDDIAQLYRDLRHSGDLSYEKVIAAFEAHQGKWSEAIFNADMYTKCIEPLFDPVKPESRYLPMLQGKKELWLRWWLYNRFRYLDSKYGVGGKETEIVLRASEKAELYLKSYLNMYGRVHYNDEISENRMERDDGVRAPYRFVWNASGAEDPVIKIDNGDMITSLGDLSGLGLKSISAGAAKRLTELIIGSATNVNYAFGETETDTTENALDLDTHILLRKLDVRNCPNLTQTVDLRGCTNIEEAYFDGTGIQGIYLPNGGILKKLHLPNTITSLTLRNQTALTEFVLPAPCSNLDSLTLENNASVVDPFAIFGLMKENGSVRIKGLKKENATPAEVIEFITKLGTMQKAEVSGTITTRRVTPGQSVVIDGAVGSFPNLTITYAGIRKPIVEFVVDGSVVATVEADENGNVAAPNNPTKVGGANEKWVFTGWDHEFVTIDGSIFLTNVIDDMVCTAQFENQYSNARKLVSRTLDGTYVNDRVERVGAYAFEGCSYLVSVRLGNVSTIGPGAFTDCSALTAVILPADKVCVREGTATFGGTPIANGTGYIYVPGTLVDTYKYDNDKGWKMYADQILAKEDYPEITGG